MLNSHLALTSEIALMHEWLQNVFFFIYTVYAKSNPRFDLHVVNKNQHINRLLKEQVTWKHNTNYSFDSVKYPDSSF